MSKTTRYPKLKGELKELAKELKYWKPKRKFDKRGNYTLYQINAHIWKRKYEFRHKHIAYCQLRGRLRWEIEKPALDNLPKEKYIEEIMSKHGETLCASTQKSV